MSLKTIWEGHIQQRVRRRYNPLLASETSSSHYSIWPVRAKAKRSHRLCQKSSGWCITMAQWHPLQGMSKTPTALMETAESGMETGSSTIFLGRSNWSLHPKGRAVKAAEPVQAHIPAQCGGQDLLWGANWNTGVVLVGELSGGYISAEGRASRLPRLLGTLQYDLAHYPRGEELEAGSSSGLVGPSKCLLICMTLVDQVCIGILPHPRKDHQNGGYLLWAV